MLINGPGAFFDLAKLRAKPGGDLASGSLPGDGLTSGSASPGADAQAPAEGARAGQNAGAALWNNFAQQLAQALPQLASVSSESEMAQLWQFLQNNFSSDLNTKGLLRAHDLQQKLGDLLAFARVNLSPTLGTQLENLVAQSLAQAKVEGTPFAEQAQGALNALRNNDFAQLAPILDKLWHNPPQNMAEAAPLLNLLAPLQELQSLGAPPEINAQQLQSWVQNLQNWLAAPVPAGADLPAGIQQFMVATPQQGELVLIPTAQSSVQIPLSPAWNQALTPQIPVWGLVLPSTSSDGGNSLSFNLPVDSLVAQSGAKANPATTQAVLPQAATQWLPAAELDYWRQTDLPLTPNVVEARNFVAELGGLPAPQVMRNFVEVLHQLELQLPPGSALSDLHKELALRWVLTNPGAKLPPGLEHYGEQDQKGPDLYQMLSEPSKILLKGAWTEARQPVSEAQLLQWMESVSLPKVPEGDQAAWQGLKQQLQWSQFDGQTQHPNDREMVYYMLQGGEMQKYKVHFDGQNEERKRAVNLDTPRALYIETSTPRLGVVRVNISARQGELHLEFRDSVGGASAALQAERESLAQELGEIGWRLATLQYQQPFKKTGLGPGSATGSGAPSFNTSFLDLRA